MSTVTDRKRWISGAQARRITGLTWASLLKLGATGQIRTQAMPGVAMKFDAEDAERVARELNEQVSK